MEGVVPLGAVAFFRGGIEVELRELMARHWVPAEDLPFEPSPALSGHRLRGTLRYRIEHIKRAGWDRENKRAKYAWDEAVFRLIWSDELLESIRRERGR